jgi:exonuclease SbcD
VRILHTSDWHLGRCFHGAALLDEQEEAADRIVELAAEHRVELVVVAGDLFDRAIPPAPAVELLDRTLARLRATGARVAAISGNHDSAVRVRMHDRLLNELGVALRGDASRVAEPLVVDHPADGGPPVAVYLVPFLEPSVDGPVLAAPGASEPAAGGSGRITHDAAVRLATERIREHLATLGPVRSVVVAHAFVAGGKVSDSERDLSVGGSDRVAESAFDGFDLVALGHLHHPQEVAGPRLAYSGSPLPYSFSEEGQEKSVRIVDLAPDGAVQAQVVALGAGRPVRTLTGTLEELLTHPDHADAVDARVRARLTDAHLPNQAMARLRQRFPHALELRHEPPGRAEVGQSPARQMAELESASPLDLALRFWADQQGAEPTAAEAALLERAVAASALGAPR